MGTLSAELGRQERPTNITPRFRQTQRDDAESQLQVLQIDAYECLHCKRKDLVLEAVEICQKP